MLRPFDVQYKNSQQIEFWCCGQVWDAPLLGAWVHKMRKVHKEGRLPGWQVAKLDELVFAWKMEQQSAKWHHNLHEARRFKVGAKFSPSDEGLAVAIDLFSFGKDFLLSASYDRVSSDQDISARKSVLERASRTQEFSRPFHGDCMQGHVADTHFDLLVKNEATWGVPHMMRVAVAPLL